jgi:hypothetical protein
MTALDKSQEKLSEIYLPMASLADRAVETKGFGYPRIWLM